MTIFAEILFAKMEKSFCFNPNTDPGLFGHKAVLGIRDILVRIRIQIQLRIRLRL
jgi:hypothetical protein